MQTTAQASMLEIEVLVLPVIGQTLRDGEDITTERLNL